MKNLFFIVCICLSHIVSAQETLPTIQLKNLNGKAVEVDTLYKQHQLTVINFWATWCKPCVEELSAIDEQYTDWTSQIDVQIVAVSVDDSRSVSRVPTFVNGRGWQYSVLLDPNGELKRALNVEDIPHTFIINKEGNIVWQHKGYINGDEEILYNTLLQLSNQ